MAILGPTAVHISTILNGGNRSTSRDRGGYPSTRFIVFASLLLDDDDRLSQLPTFLADHRPGHHPHLDASATTVTAPGIRIDRGPSRSRRWDFRWSRCVWTGPVKVDGEVGEASAEDAVGGMNMRRKTRPRCWRLQGTEVPSAGLHLSPVPAGRMAGTTALNSHADHRRRRYLSRPHLTASSTFAHHPRALTLNAHPVRGHAWAEE